MAQRSRKKGQRSRAPGTRPRTTTPAEVESGTVQTAERQPATRAESEAFVERYRARNAERDAAARATLEPLAPGERPWPILVGVALTAIAGIGNLVLFVAGATIEGKHPSAGGIVLFSVVMLVCSVGMWRLWYQAVLGFMALLAIVVILFSLFLIEASNLLGLLVPPIFIVAGGYEFWKLVRVLGRIQMPAPPRR